MKISKERLLSEAAATGFRPEVLEKVIHVMNLLEGFRSQPFLKERLVLKGGTALNLFLFDLPRLSVDIDLNYIGATERDSMLRERPKIEEAIQSVCDREGFSLRRYPNEHAGGKWSLRYPSSLGQNGNLEVDLNYMFRSPLWPVVKRDSRSVGSYQSSGIPVLDIHELAAGKLAAILARHQARDLFDAHKLFERVDLDPKRLRIGFVVYGAMNRKDWRTVSVNDVHFEERELRNQLIPLLRRDSVPTGSQAVSWGNRLAGECRQGFDTVLPFSESELAFLDLLLDSGEINPSLLTSDSNLADRIKYHPLLEWKALNVRKHKKP